MTRTNLILLAEAESSDAQKLLGLVHDVDACVLGGPLAPLLHVPLVGLRESGGAGTQAANQAAGTPQCFSASRLMSAGKAFVLTDQARSR